MFSQRKVETAQNRQRPVYVKLNEVNIKLQRDTTVSDITVITMKTSISIGKRMLIKTLKIATR